MIEVGCKNIKIIDYLQEGNIFFDNICKLDNMQVVKWRCDRCYDKKPIYLNKNIIIL